MSEGPCRSEGLVIGVVEGGIEMGRDLFGSTGNGTGGMLLGDGVDGAEAALSSPMVRDRR